MRSCGTPADLRIAANDRPGRVLTFVDISACIIYICRYIDGGVETAVHWEPTYAARAHFFVDHQGAPMADLNLPHSELDIMSCLWQGASTAAEIRKSLAARRPMAHSTVCTLLKRLEDKGL